MISTLYEFAMQLRNAAYDRGLLRALSAGVPVISVGNITAGGTGKTPVVEALISRLLAAGNRPAMVTRGYRRESRGQFVVSDGAGRLRGVRQSGDEPYQVANRFPDVPVIADEKRIRGCRHAVQAFGSDILLLDDAFQHRAVARDCDVVVVDAQEGLDGLRMLPRGRLREPLRNLARADMILLSRCTDLEHGARLRDALRRFSAAPAFMTRFAVTDFIRIPPSGEHPGASGDRRLSADSVRGTRVLAFCGIGSPRSFGVTLRDAGLDVADQREYPDHHWYSKTDLRTLHERADGLHAEVLCTTEKDAMRLRALPEKTLRKAILYPRIALEFLEGEEEFFSLLGKRTGMRALS
jgi:tetraacyldisaccharide 4'-kinase